MKDINKKIVIIILLAVIGILFIGLGIYLVFIKKDDITINNDKNTHKQNNIVDNKENSVFDSNDNKKTNGEKIEFIKHVSSYVGDLYLDSHNQVYFSLSDKVKDSDKLKSIRNKQEKYTNIVKNDNYNSDYLEASIIYSFAHDINYVKDGKNGYGYFTIDDQGDGLFLISDEKIEQDGILEMLLPNVLKIDILSVGEEKKDDSVLAYAIDTYGRKIYLSEAIKNDIEGIEITNNNQNIFFDNQNIEAKIISIDNDTKGELYINNKKIATLAYNNILLYPTKKFIIVTWPGGGCGEYVVGYINEDFIFKEDDNISSVDELHYEDDEVMGIIREECGDYSIKKKAQFTYKNKNVIVKTIDKKSNADHGKWIDYILKQDIISITLASYDVIDRTDLRVDMSKKQLEEFFNSFKEKKYFMSRNYGLGKGTPSYELIIIYNKNNKKYKVEFQDSAIFVSFVESKYTDYNIDEEFLKVLESVEHTISGEEYKTSDWKEHGFYLYNFSDSLGNFDNTLYERFLKK